MNSNIRYFKFGVSIALALTFSQGAVGVANVVTTVNKQAATAAFTAADFAAARPVTPTASLSAATPLKAQEITIGLPVSTNGSGPTAKVPADKTAKLFDPAFYPAPEPALDLAPLPADKGSSGANYTLSSMIPDTQANATSYPHITTGKLYFKTYTGGSGYCTASVIQHRIIVTAGHCVSDGLGHWYSNFQFVPGTWNNSIPWHIWNYAAVATTTTWLNGGGGVPNAADYAMIELQDSYFAPNYWKIGDITGWLGWQTASCSNNHLHILGYPANVFSGIRLSLASSQTWRNVAPLNCEYGTPQTQGASGGPQIQNFAPYNPIPQTNPGSLRVVSVTSYTYAEGYGILGASNPDSRWVNMWNWICGRRAGNCS